MQTRVVESIVPPAVKNGGVGQRPLSLISLLNLGAVDGIIRLTPGLMVSPVRCLISQGPTGSNGSQINGIATQIEPPAEMAMTWSRM